MTLRCRLIEVLAQNVLEPQKDGSISLRERQRDSRMKVTVSTPSISVAAIRLSKSSHLPVLKDGPWKRICDYLLVYAFDGIEYAIFVELKKTLSDNNGPKEQLRRSLPFLEYLRSVCDIEYGNETAHSNMRIRYFRIGEKLSPRFDKQFVKVGPDRILKREEYENIAINTLVGPRVSLATLSRA